MSSNSRTIIIAGVGGQGNILASRVLGLAAMKAGFDVKVSEVHGMSQRGGSVITYVRYGEEVISPVVTEGEADYVITFEILESARWISLLKGDGVLLTGKKKIPPVPVLSGAREYPEGIEDMLERKGIDYMSIDAERIAETAGLKKAENIVMLGAFAAYSDLDIEFFFDAMKDAVPERFYEINKTAFIAGYDEVKNR